MQNGIDMEEILHTYYWGTSLYMPQPVILLGSIRCALYRISKSLEKNAYQSEVQGFRLILK